MIVPQELRLGNLVKTLEGIFEIRTINQHYLTLSCGIISTYPAIEPIELTEEWLQKFGLNNSETGYELIVKQTKFSAIKAKGFFSVGLAGPFGLYLVKLKYVHQLQNLYQSVFLEELTIKEQS